MDTAYEPNEWGNNLKIALIQKREEFSDSPLPRMYDTELIRYDNSHSEVVTKFKVIKNTYCNLFVSIRGKYIASAFRNVWTKFCSIKGWNFVCFFTQIREPDKSHKLEFQNYPKIGAICKTSITE